ncbi:PaaI family thioesterase [Terriglobus sp. TAA 43]|uniref:PaaI family thioesterase n=1 Tax=Terriglobus sp. TAA 43 TaxID=278961 RepID=UPI00068C21A2|nr:PaaI family thioesterase [Terriglobus sp. TAA 43]
MAVLAASPQNVLTKSPGCYVCGPKNPAGLGIRFGHTAPFTAEARTIARREHEGWNGILHGGITFTLMDEALGWCLHFEGIQAVTAKVETRFLRPVPTDAVLCVRAWVTQDRGRVVYASAEVTSGDRETVFAEATATMMRARPGAEKKQ